MIKPTTKNNKDWMGLLAQKLAEVRLSEVGFRFVPGVFPFWRRVKQVLEAKARIVRLDNKGQSSLTPEKAMADVILNGVREFEKRSSRK